MAAVVGQNVGVQTVFSPVIIKGVVSRRFKAEGEAGPGLDIERLRFHSLLMIDLLRSFYLSKMRRHRLGGFL